jgi:pyridoxal phosphate enzyme (YggS family)
MSLSISATQIAANLKDVRARLHQAATYANLRDTDVSLIAVSKTHDAEAVEAAIAAGQHVFGENRVQEAAGKFPALRAAHPALELHLIGPLQSNKVKDAVALFDVIHTLDRDSLAEALSKEIKRAGEKAPRLFVQVNTGEEPQKAGIAPTEAVAFVTRCRDHWGLQVDGLMCIPPVDDEPAPHFALLRKLGRQAGVKELSMGMSHDFEIAVTLGATHVRVGSAIFGAREPG